MPQRRSIVFGSLFLAGLVVIAWTEYYPSSGMFAALGMPGPRANSGRVCGQLARQEYIRGVRTFIPTRSLKCNRVIRWSSPLQREEVDLDVVNRKLLHAERLWADLDSTEWQKERDSIASGLVRLGGHEIVCAKNPYVQTHIRNTRFWKFSTFSVRLVAYKFEQELPGGPWLLQLDGYPTLPDECVYDPWRFSRD
jgi:hypothetical protein